MMDRQAMKKKVDHLLQRFAEVETALGDPNVFDDQKKYKVLAQEHAQLHEVKTVWEQLQKSHQHLEDNRTFLKEQTDPAFVEELNKDIVDLEKKIADLETKIQNLLVPPDPNDSRNAIIELRAGTGGDEAAIFVGDCVRMYKLFADRLGWHYEHLSSTPSEMGGFKEYVMVLSGHNVYRYLKYEGGTHRVQRVPETEAQGRVHTSAVTIAVLLEPDEEHEVKIDEKELRVDTYRSSGAGGQHVNTTDSAVRLTHLPTGIVVYCQEERSQHKNKDKAMRLLKAKIAEVEQEKKLKEISESRSSQVGSGDRSERIRTYNFPQNRLTDHRINLTKYNLDTVMDGDLEEIVFSLVSHFAHEKLNA